MRGVLVLLFASIALDAKVEVGSDFPGGSVVVDALDEEARTFGSAP